MPTAYAIVGVANRIRDVMRKQKRRTAGFTSGMEEILGHSRLLEGIAKELLFTEAHVFRWGSIDDRLNSVEEVLYEVDDMLDEWDLAIRNLVTLPSEACRCIPLYSGLISDIPVPRPDLADKIEEVVTKLASTNEEKDFVAFRMSETDRFHEQRRLRSNALVNMDEIHGRHLDRDILLRKIMVEGDHKVKFMSVVGLAGIGKTTVAQLIYNDSRVTDRYPFRIWVSVSNYIDVVGLAKDIIKMVSGYVPSAWLRDSPEELLRYTLCGKRYFLVLDDVLEGHYFQCCRLTDILREGAEGSTVMVTTRNERVPVLFGDGREIYRLKELSDKSCWSILSDTALSGRSFNQLAKFKDVGMRIAKKCRGIPYTAKVLGSLLHSKCSVEEWEIVLETPLWELKEVKEEIFGPLLLTYHQLPPYLRCCFSYCGAIPKGFVVSANKLIWCWSALGYLDFHEYWHDLDGAQEYLHVLAKHSLFHEIVRDQFNPQHIVMCKMYDIVHDLGQFLRKNATNNMIGGTTCEACRTSLASDIKKYHSLFVQKDPPAYICDCLKSLRVLSLRDCKLERIPRNMVILIHLRFLDLSYNEGLCEEDLQTICKLYYLEILLLSSCGLEEIPTEIENLFQLKCLDLSSNSCLIELSESICSLLELRILNLDECYSLAKLPEGIYKLGKLTHLHNLFTGHSCPKGLERLTNLRNLNEFSGKLSLLKELCKLKGSLQLKIPESCCLDDVAEAREAKMWNKRDIHELEILFPSQWSILGEDSGSKTISLNILDALEPHSSLRYLKIELYSGSKLPLWVADPFNFVREIELQQCNHLSSLPPLGRLELLEVLTLQEMDGLQCVGRNFLGLTTKGVIHTVAFPKLKALIFYKCPNWTEWEDIKTQEEESGHMLIMPHLKKLDVVACGDLALLPHCLLRKAAALEELDIYDSIQLVRVYENKEGSNWKSISHIPQVWIG